MWEGDVMLALNERHVTSPGPHIHLLQELWSSFDSKLGRAESLRVSQLEPDPMDYPTSHIP
jgi:hypothetical protein